MIDLYAGGITGCGGNINRMNKLEGDEYYKYCVVTTDLETMQKLSKQEIEKENRKAEIRKKRIEEKVKLINANFAGAKFNIPGLPETFYVTVNEASMAIEKRSKGYIGGDVEIYYYNENGESRPHRFRMYQYETDRGNFRPKQFAYDIGWADNKYQDISNKESKEIWSAMKAKKLELEQLINAL